jgi:hypothetical protein
VRICQASIVRREAAQAKDDRAEDVSEWCGEFCQKTIGRVNDEATQRINNEEAEAKSVADYNGIMGASRQQEKFLMRATMDQVIKRGVTVEIARTQTKEKTNSVA